MIKKNLIKFFLSNEKKKNRSSIGLLLIVILIFFLPGLLQFEKLMRIDGPWQAFPKMLSIARYIKNGEIPLWNQETFLGGKPFYSMYEGPLFNLFLYPFYLIANPDNYTQSYYVLYLIPYMLYVIFGSIGFYFFAKKIIKLNYISSIITAISYALAPHILLYIDSFHPAIIYAIIPWVLYSISNFFEAKKLKWWILSLFFLLMMELSYDTNTIIRVYFVVSLISFLIWLFIYSKREKAFFTLFAIVLVFIFSVTLLAFLWAGILEGISWFKETDKMTYKSITDYYTSNVWPGFLITLFIPHFTGANPGSHAWGKTIGVDHNIIFSGGLAIGFCIITCVAFTIIYYKTKKDEKKELEKIKKSIAKKEVKIKAIKEYYYKESFDQNKIYFSWIFIGLLLYVGTIVVMMGKYTPIYFILCKLLPFLFEVPYPFYYRFVQCLGASILTGIGINLLIENKNFQNRKININLIIVYIFIVLLLSLVALLENVDHKIISDNTYNQLPHISKLLNYVDSLPNKRIPAYKTILYFNETGWFISGPLLYTFVFFIFFIILIFIEFHSIKNFIGIMIFFDILFFGYFSFYKNENIGRLSDRSIQEKLNMIRSALPNEHPIFMLAEKLKKELKNDHYRYISPISDRDNAAWICGEHSACGYDGKPILTKVQKALTYFMRKWPYHMTTLFFPVHFLDNMNIGYIVIPEGLLDKKGLEEIIFNTENQYYSNLNGFKVYRIKNVDVNTSVKHEISGVDHTIIKLKEPMPYIYTHDNITVVNNDDIQLLLLLNDDLRKSVYIYKKDEDKIPLEKKDFLPINEADYSNYFTNLQNENKILSVDRTKANKLTIKASIKKPCLLVRVEAYHKDWKVKIDGKKSEVLNVNYLQQAVFLNAGEHIIEFTFFPSSLKIGLYITLTVFIVLLLFILLWAICEKNKFKKRG